MSTLAALGLPLSLPIVQAPMAGVQDHTLAIAVSDAGGLGSVPAAMLGVDALRDTLRTLAAHPTLPFNVNFFCHTTPPADPAREAAWRRVLAAYCAEAGLDPHAPARGPERAPFQESALEALATHPPAVVSFHFGLPSAPLLLRVKALGARVWSSATTVDEGRWLVDHGADVVIAQGLEAGGHRGSFLGDAVDALPTQPGMLALLDGLVRALDVPVVAAGGIARAAHVREVLARGAAAAQVGTAYLLCPEARTSPVHRRALRARASDPSPVDTVVTNVFSGRPARGIPNRLTRELGPLRDDVPAFPGAAGALGGLRAWAEASGRDDFSPLWSGADGSGCREVPAGELTRSLAGASPDAG